MTGHKLSPLAVRKFAFVETWIAYALDHQAYLRTKLGGTLILPFGCVAQKIPIELQHLVVELSRGCR
jgi:hypothetical protein